MRLFFAFFATVCCVCAVGCGRLSSHPIVGVAKGEVARNARVAELLGESVECSPTVSGRANETDGIATLQFEVHGSKARGIVVVEGKKSGAYRRSGRKHRHGYAKIRSVGSVHAGNVAGSATRRH